MSDVLVVAERYSRLVRLEPRTGALRWYDSALDLWHGQSFGGARGPFVDGQRARLDEVRVTLLEERAATLLDHGDTADLVAELRALVVAYPFRERLYALLMTALCRDGRNAEALAAYATVRRALRDELGVEPGPYLRSVHSSVLRAGTVSSR